jgi:hypothetical protein
MEAARPQQHIYISDLPINVVAQMRDKSGLAGYWGDHRVAPPYIIIFINFHFFFPPVARLWFGFLFPGLPAGRG